MDRSVSYLTGTLPAPKGAISGFWRWRSLLPLDGLRQPVSLGEGGTPLLRSRTYGERLWWKDETRNPTGSHKDRPLALAATHALEVGARVFAVFSAGSTGLSAAAYAARAGMPAAILMSEGAPAGRIAPLASLGARLLELPVAIDEGIAALAALSGRHGIYVASTTRAVNAVQAEASRTIAYEIVDALGRAPDQVVIPVGGGGTLAALHDGFAQLKAMGLTDRVPRLIAVVPDRYDTLSAALARGVEDEADFFGLPDPEGGPTILNKIAHAHAPDGVHALRALRESAGRVLTVSDDEALDAVADIGAAEGLYLEPSSAVAWVALRQLEREGELDGVAVALACGSGFRETHVLLERAPPGRERVSLETLEETLAALAGGSA